MTSKDGTSIAYSRVGSGPPTILVDGALCWRQQGPNAGLAEKLADHFTVYTYDRRGRGESGDTPPFNTMREIEDLEALINEVGGSAFVYGISSGATLALDAAASGLAIAKLAIFEPPHFVDDTRPPLPEGYQTRLEDLVKADERGKAVKLFMTEGINLPSLMVGMMRLMPAWRKLKSIAHTLPYDVSFVVEAQQGKPLSSSRWSAVTVPTLAVVGGKSPKWMHNGVRATASVLPNAKYFVLEGEMHIVKPKALAPVLTEFFANEMTPNGRWDDPFAA
nr:alpha/beta hydrolase [Jiangella ureilytica]